MLENNIHKILVGVNGSELSTRSIKMAIPIARLCNATLTGVYVQEIQHKEFATVNESEPQQDDFETKFINEAKALANENDIPFVIEIKKGNPEYIITEMVNSGEYDLLVVGAHGFRGIRGKLSSDIAKNIVRDSKIPVLTVK